MRLVGGIHRRQRPPGVGEPNADLVEAGHERGRLPVGSVGDLHHDQPMLVGHRLGLAIVSAGAWLVGQYRVKLVLPVHPTDLGIGIDKVGEWSAAD